MISMPDTIERITQHHSLVRDQLARHRGREIDNAGDGFLAAFDGLARAVRCRRAIVGSVKNSGFMLRTYAVSPSSSPDRRRHNPWRALRKRRLRQCRCVDAEAPCERLGKPATEQWFSWPASPSRSPTFATKSATSRLMLLTLRELATKLEYGCSDQGGGD
jgi:hypothetical protein